MEGEESQDPDRMRDLTLLPGRVSGIVIGREEEESPLMGNCPLHN